VVEGRKEDGMSCERERWMKGNNFLFPIAGKQGQVAW
jgi:hypothetical protein